MLTPGGVIKVNNVRRLPPSQRKDPELLKVVKGLPWCLKPIDKKQGEAGVGDAPVKMASEPVVPEEELPRVVRPRVEDSKAKNFYIRRDVELTLYGFTPGCAGCDAAQAGKAARRPWEERRARIEKAVEEASDSFKEEAQVKERLVAARCRLRDAAEDPKFRLTRSRGKRQRTKVEARIQARAVTQAAAACQGCLVDRKQRMVTRRCTKHETKGA